MQGRQFWRRGFLKNISIRICLLIIWKWAWYEAEILRWPRKMMKNWQLIYGLLCRKYQCDHILIEKEYEAEIKEKIKENQKDEAENE